MACTVVSNFQVNWKQKSLTGKVLCESCQERIHSHQRRLHPLDVLVNVLNLTSQTHVDSLVKLLDLLVQVCLGVFPFLSIFALLEEGFEGLDCLSRIDQLSSSFHPPTPCRHLHALDLSNQAVL